VTSELPSPSSASTHDRNFLYGDPDGFGRYGIVEETSDGLTCHDCGHGYGHLGLHVYKAHGIKAADYKVAHGLRRTKGLISRDIQDKIRQQKTIAYDPVGALATARNPDRASTARLTRGLRASAEEVAARDSRLSYIGRSARVGRVITCGFCGVRFCPIRGNNSRRYCSRRCAGRAIRAHESAQPGTSTEDLEQ